MKHLLIAAALLGFAYFIATKDELPKYVPPIDRDLMAVDGPDGALITEDPAETEAIVFANQIEALSYHLKTDPQETKTQIRAATKVCFADGTADMVIESLAIFVQITAQSFELSDTDRPDFIRDQVAQMSMEFDDWAGSQTDEVRERALNVFLNQMEDPLSLINCNAGWLSLPE